MELEIKKTITVEEGLHKGIITKISYRNTPYEYTDVFIEIKKELYTTELSASYPTLVMDSSKLGKLLIRFCAILEIGKKIEPEKILIGKKCQFLVTQEQTDKGTFARIIADSMKPTE